MSAWRIAFFVTWVLILLALLGGFWAMLRLLRRLDEDHDERGLLRDLLTQWVTHSTSQAERLKDIPDPDIPDTPDDPPQTFGCDFGFGRLFPKLFP